MKNQILQKYNIPGPRYTSYPTVPYWEDNPTEEEWKRQVKDRFLTTEKEEGISLYIHLPYCESLCTYCACNTRITVNHKVERPYIDTLLKEWQMYLDNFGRPPVLKEIHLGGGTPTFFQPENLQFLLSEIYKTVEIPENKSFSFEGHPKNTSLEHLQVLYDLGFRRVSFGIQDFDPKVQATVNRIQPFAMVEEVTKNAREIGYESINFDLIYGLPFQTLDSVRNTINLVNQLRPERIAFYSYAHVPWMKPGQRSFTKMDLPKDEEKRQLYELGKQLFEEKGYLEIGMDHFALPSDELYQRFAAKQMHRNFMGYTTASTAMIIGLGVSAISDSWTGFVQNEKRVEQYTAAVEQGRIPFFRGHKLNAEDLTIRRFILELMCHFQADWSEMEGVKEEIPGVIERLQELAKDDLIRISEDGITVKESGKPFVRNICMAADLRMHRMLPETAVFSATV